MDLDNYQGFTQIDPDDMLAQIEDLPDQLRRAWLEHGLTSRVGVASGMRRAA